MCVYVEFLRMHSNCIPTTQIAIKSIDSNTRTGKKKLNKNKNNKNKNKNNKTI